jgi:hypothetical protein
MQRPYPVKLRIEYNDGSVAETAFVDLPQTLRNDLQRQPFASQPDPEPDQGKYLVLEWDDGWQEVIAVDPDCVAINRYYVIARPEEVGRLSLNKRNDLPELVEIQRSPLHLKRITFLHSWELAPDHSTREGRKTEHFFRLTNEGPAFADQLEALDRALAETGIAPEDLRGPAGSTLLEGYERIRRSMGLNATLSRQDAYDFIACLARIAEQR